MLRNLIQVYKSENLTTQEQMLSIGGGLMLLRQGIARPGPLGLVSLALGAMAIYSGAKAFTARAQSQAEDKKSPAAARRGKKLAPAITRAKRAVRPK